MLVTLKRNATVMNGSVLAATLSGLLTKTITNVSQLDATYFDLSNCSFTVGSYASHTAWTLESTASGYTLSRASLNTGKTNYLRIDWSGNTAVMLYSGTGHTSGVLKDTTSVAYAYYTDINSSSNTFYIRIANNFIHVHSNCTYSGTYAYSAMAFEFNNNHYDQYSQEGSLKTLNMYWCNQNTTALTLKVPRIYVPWQHSLLADSSDIPCYNFGNQLKLNNVGISKADNAIDNSHLLIPIIFNQLSTGWLGGNISTATGLYLTTSGNAITDTVVTVGSDSYLAINSTITLMTLLAKI